MRGLSNRELEARMQWLDDQWNNPSRSDYYAMQIAMEVRRVLSSKPNEIKLDQFQVPFKWKRMYAAVSGMTKEEAGAYAKSKWVGIAGMGKYVLDKVAGMIVKKDKK